jgi:hypothetical protein
VNCQVTIHDFPGFYYSELIEQACENQASPDFPASYFYDNIDWPKTCEAISHLWLKEFSGEIDTTLEFVTCESPMFRQNSTLTANVSFEALQNIRDQITKAELQAQVEKQDQSFDESLFDLPLDQWDAFEFGYLISHRAQAMLSKDFMIELPDSGLNHIFSLNPNTH